MASSSLSTTNIWPYYSSSNVQKAASKTDSNELGKDQFLKILIAQLKNQDPMQPMEDKEFIAQMAQFSSVEQLTSISSELALLRQSVGLTPSLIGKSVSWTETDSSGYEINYEGIVEAITFKSGKQYANVDGTEVSLDQLTKIWDPEITS